MRRGAGGTPPAAETVNAMNIKKSEVMERIDAELADNPQLRRRVEEILTEIRIEQAIIQLREARGLSQAALAKILGISQPAIARIESGKEPNLKLSTLAKVTAALGGRLKLEIEKAPVAKRAKRKLARTA